MKNITITLILSIASALTTMAQAPNWVVNANEFENSMAVVAVAEVRSVELTSTSSMIGAFVNNELRGVASTSFVNADDRYVAHILVWSNTGGGETVTFQIYDADNDEMVSSVNSITFQNDGTEGNTSAPYVVRDNNVPMGVELSASAIDENSEVGTEVGQFSTIDIDNGDSHTYSLVAGEGDDDNDAFSIDQDKLLLAVSPDFETKDELSLRVRTTDAKNGLYEKVFTITINDINDAPTDLELSANTINENNAVGDAIGVLSTEDQDAGDTFEYALVSGEGDTDNAAFSISGSQLVANQPFNFEEQDTYSIRLSSTDNEDDAFEKQFEVRINDINDRPTRIMLSDTAIAENQGAGVLVGTFTSTDDDTANGHIYSFTGTGNNDNDDFAIVGDQLFTKVVFNFEGRRTYFINILTDDQNGGLFSEIIDLAITNTNDPPTAISMSDQLVAENLPAGTVVGDLETEDQDSNDGFTYRLVSGAGDSDNDLFNIVGDEVRTAGTLNFESSTNYSIRVRSRDTGGSSVESSFVIEVEDKNDVPTDIILDNNTTLENLAPGIVVGSLTTMDEDARDDHFYALVEGEGDTDNHAFAIADGRLITAKTFDFESRSSYSVRIATNDRNDGIFEKPFTVEIIDTNDDPTLLQLSNLDIDENQPVGTGVGDLSIEDEDLGEPAFSLVPGTNDNNLFKVDGSSLLTIEVFDHEADAQYFIDVLGNDGSGGLVVNRFEITVNDINDHPESVALNSNAILENQPLGTIVGQLSTSDQDIDDDHTYALVAGEGDTDNGLFRLAGNELLTDANFNYEEASVYSVRVQSTDASGSSIAAAFQISIEDANDTPTDIVLSANQIEEEQPTGIFIGEFDVIDEDADDLFNIRLVGGEGGGDNDSFVINGNQLLSNATFDAESETNFTIRVNVTDAGGEAISKIFNIAILPINEPPSIAAQEFSIEERSSAGALIGTITASDVDGDLPSFELETVDVPFGLDEASGDLTVTGKIDYESLDIYELIVAAIDPGGLRSSTTITINVLDVVESDGDLPFNDFVSPNNDGFNDFLEIQNVGLYTHYTLRIFNNAGLEVYSSSAYRNTWNGVDNSGRELAVGSYYFTFISSSNPISFRGSITLIR